jgi:hypothetical protein
MNRAPETSRPAEQALDGTSREVVLFDLDGKQQIADQANETMAFIRHYENISDLSVLHIGWIGTQNVEVSVNSCQWGSQLV